MLNDEKDIIRKIVKHERRNSEMDTVALPVTSKVLDWTKFNTDFMSTDRQFSEVRAICDNN